jgi:hypothetical protein
MGDLVSRGSSRPLLVAGVAGGVGTSTWVRALSRLVALPIRDLGVYPVDDDPGPVGGPRRGSIVDVLVTSNTAAATAPARLGRALALCPRPPVLVVMHTVPGSIGAARAHLRAAQPHVTRLVSVMHQPYWLELEEPPGKHLPKGFAELVRSLPEAFAAMYAAPPRPPRVASPHPPQFRSANTSWPPAEPAGTAAARTQWPPGGPTQLSGHGQRP